MTEGAGGAGRSPLAVAVGVGALELRDVRSWPRLELEIPPGLALLHGPNGAGKTNLLEAACCLLTGSSARTTRQARVVREGAGVAVVRGRVGGPSGIEQRSWGIEPGGRRSLRRDGEEVASATAFGAGTPVAAFFPERLLTMRGAPARRRALVDRLAARVIPAAAAAQRRYVEALTQRNALLRGARGSMRAPHGIEPWNEQLVELGGTVRAARAEVLSGLAPLLGEEHAGLAGGDLLEVVPDERGADLARALEEQAAAELRRGTTLAGPHLDDLSFRREGSDLRHAGSTGQQRTALLAWMLAEARLVEERTGTVPALLLDDPLAELDDGRVERLLARVAGWPSQVIVTTPALPEPMPVDSASALVAQGTVGAWTSLTA